MNCLYSKNTSEVVTTKTAEMSSYLNWTTYKDIDLKHSGLSLDKNSFVCKNTYCYRNHEKHKLFFLVLEEISFLHLPLTSSSATGETLAVGSLWAAPGDLLQNLSPYLDHGAVWSISITVVCMLFKVGESETRSSTCTNPPRYRESMQQPKYPTLTEGWAQKV